METYMTIQLFIALLAAGAALTILFTNSIKQFYYNEGKNAPPNLIALLNAIIIGGGEGIFIYILFAIPFTISNILWLLFLVFLVWNASMQGWDKILQTYNQYQKWKEQIGGALGQNITDPAEPNDLTGAAADDLKNKKN